MSLLHFQYCCSLETDPKIQLQYAVSLGLGYTIFIQTAHLASLILFHFTSLLVLNGLWACNLQNS
jgi:hypothetical protein